MAARIERIEYPHASFSTGLGGVIAEADKPLWSKPSPLGAANAIDAIATVAAPPLAGFALATVAVVAQSENSFRWPGPCMLLCVITAASMVISIQFGFTARSFSYTPLDIEAWWPEASKDHERQAWLRAEHDHHFEQWRRLANRARLAYNTGVVALTLSLAALAAPPHGAGQASVRWLAAALSIAATIAIVVTTLRRTRITFNRRISDQED
jgi:hypothetical protein